MCIHYTALRVMVRILSSMLSAGGGFEMWTFLGKQDATVKIKSGETFFVCHAGLATVWPEQI